MTFEEWWERHGEFISEKLNCTSATYEDLARTVWDAARPKWEPMETAPLYEPILMRMKHGVIEGEWDGEVGHGYYSRDMEWYPTHWMPLPK